MQAGLASEPISYLYVVANVYHVPPLMFVQDGPRKTALRPVALIRVYSYVHIHMQRVYTYIKVAAMSRSTADRVALKDLKASRFVWLYFEMSPMSPIRLVSTLLQTPPPPGAAAAHTLQPSLQSRPGTCPSWPCPGHWSSTAGDL